MVIEKKHAKPNEPDAPTKAFYVDALKHLDEAGVPYLVGGGYAMAYYTGIARNTKDLDIFLRPSDRDRALTTLAAAGYRTEFFYEFWIAKALSGDAFMDILYSSGNGLCVVDDAWFEHATEMDILDYPTRLVPAEEQLWSKAFVQDRDRFDGADVHHLILSYGDVFDWRRLLSRFRGHEHVLLSHLVMFHYAFPSEKRCVPEWVMDRLFETVRTEPVWEEKVVRGTNVSQLGYLPDVSENGYADGRVRPWGPVSEDEVRQLPGMQGH